MPCVCLTHNGYDPDAVKERALHPLKDSTVFIGSKLNSSPGEGIRRGLFISGRCIPRCKQLEGRGKEKIGCVLPRGLIDVWDASGHSGRV